MRYLIGLVLVAACGGSDGGPLPDLPIDQVGGTYAVTLTSTSDANPQNSCPSMTIVVGADSASVSSGCSGALPGPIVGDTIKITSATDGRLYRFYGFRGAADDARAAWLGPCTQPIGGGGVGCIREAGTSTWIRAE